MYAWTSYFLHVLTSFSETNLDDVLQISNVFTNVSKGEVAKSGDLKKAFATTDVATCVEEVLCVFLWGYTTSSIMCPDPQEG